MKRALAAAVLCVGIGAMHAGCAESRAEGGAAGGPATQPFDLVGTWRFCGITRTYAADGRVTLEHHQGGCIAHGAWTLEGQTLIERWSTGTCERLVGQTTIHEVLPGPDGIGLFDPANGSFTPYLDENAPVSTWVLEGREASGAEGTTVVRIVGTPRVGLGSGCYWSADLECGGMLSCGGGILEWQIEDGALSALAVCHGECPCSSRLDGTIGVDGSLQGRFHSANCRREFDGTFVGRSVAQP